MIRFTDALRAWGTPGFRDSFKAEIRALNATQLHLQEGLSGSSHALEGQHEAVVLAAAEQDGCIRAKVGIFYAGIIAGCSCADDPTPVDEQTEYCELQIDIDKDTAETTITLL
jgi:hypothetical protein